MKSKILTLLLAFVLSMGVAKAWDYEKIPIDGLYYNLDCALQIAEITSQTSTHPYWTDRPAITDLVIPAMVEFNDTTYQVTSIGKFAFAYFDGLVSATLPDSITSIGAQAFVYCTSLTDINIPDGVTKIGTGAFAECSSLPVMDNIRYAGSYLVEAVDKTLSTYTIKDGTRWIGMSAFSGCSNMTTITIPNGVISLEVSAFCDCAKLSSITIPESVEHVGRGVFMGCNNLPVIDNIRYADTYLVEAVDKTLSSYSLKSDIKWIGANAFYGCYNLTSIVLPDGVIMIDDAAFSRCLSLTSVTISKNVTNIYMYAFYDCKKLTQVTCLASTPPIMERTIDLISKKDMVVFQNVDCSQVSLYVPKGSVEAYQSADQWKEFNPIVGVDVSENIVETKSALNPSTKILRNGHLFILKGDKTYNVTGQLVR